MGMNERSNQEEVYERVEREAIFNLFDYIRENIIPSKIVIPIALSTTKLESFMSNRNENLRDSKEAYLQEIAIRDGGFSTDISRQQWNIVADF